MTVDDRVSSLALRATPDAMNVTESRSQTLPRDGNLLSVRARARRERPTAGVAKVAELAGVDVAARAHELTAYNSRVRHAPRMVTEPRSSSDVSALLRAAAEFDVGVEVIGTGHGAPSMRADSLGISTRLLRGVDVDVTARTAEVWAGSTWGDVIRRTAPHGLLPVVGSSPTVGVVGYSLGGGLGLQGRELGWSADRIRDLELVTADGTVRSVDDSVPGDLFWALRGGGGGIGVVTRLTVVLARVSQLCGGGLFFPARFAADIFRTYRTWVDTLPDEMGTSIALVRMPMTNAPLGLDGRFVVHLRVTSSVGPTRTQEYLGPMRHVAPVFHDSIRERDPSDLADIHLDPPGPMSLHEGNLLLRGLPDEALDRLLASCGPDSSSMIRLVELRHLGGALGRPPEVSNAVSHRDAEFLLHVSATSDGALQEDVGTEPVAHADHVLATLAPWSVGASLNFLGERSVDTMRACYTPATAARLVKVARAHDPDGRFRRPWPDEFEAAVTHLTATQVNVATQHAEGNFA